MILEVRGVVVDIGGESGSLLILEVRRVVVVVDIGGESGLLLILEVRVGLLLILEVRGGCC